MKAGWPPRDDRPGTTPTAAPYQPGTVKVRLAGLPAVVDAVMTDLTDTFGDGWRPQRRKRSRDNPGQVLQYGTLVVPVRRDPA